MANWFVAIGTLLLAVIAVFQDKIRAFFQSPKLHCEIDLKPPDCHRTVMTGANLSFFAFYYLFKIWNKGNISAKNVEVIISNVSKKEGNEFRIVDGFLPDNLKWSLIGPKIYCDYISPGTFKYCNLGHILDPKFKAKPQGEDNTSLPVDTKEAIFCFDVNFRSNRFSYLVAPGTYMFTITMGCENAKSQSTKYMVEITGKWFEDESRMLNEGFRINEIR